MANEVKVVFTGEASQFFQTADKVDARSKTVRDNARIQLPAGGDINGVNRGIVGLRADGAVQSLRDRLAAEEKVYAATLNTAKATSISAGATAASTKASTANAAAKGLLAESAINAATAITGESAATTALTEAALGAKVAVTGMVATVGGILALGVALVAVSSKMRSQAEARLIIEERLAATYSKQFANIRSALAEYEKFKQAARNDVGFDRSVAEDVSSNNVKALQERQRQQDQKNKADVAELARLKNALETSERALEFDKNRKVTDNVLTRLGVPGGFTELDKARSTEKTAREIERTKKQIDDLTSTLDTGKKRFLEVDNALQSITDNQNKAFNDRNETFKKNQQDTIRAEQERAERIKEQLERVKQGVEKVKELTKTYNTVFSGLLVSSNSNNPFVSLYSAGESALNSFRESTRGLTQELRDQGELLVKQQTSLNVFKARVDGAFEASDLKQDAERFRTATAKETQEQLKAKTEAAFLRAMRPGEYFGFNPVDYSKFTDTDKADIAGRYAASQLPSNVVSNRDAVAMAAYRIYNPTGDDANLSGQERLDRQLRLADVLKAGADTKEKQETIDAKIVSVGRSLDPTSLRQDQRDKIAAALERQAGRVEAREDESFKIRKQMLVYTEKIAQNQERLLSIANKQGISGVESVLKIVDETDGAINVSQNPKNPSPADTKKQYEFDGFGVLGGTNL